MCRVLGRRVPGGCPLSGRVMVSFSTGGVLAGGWLWCVGILWHVGVLGVLVGWLFLVYAGSCGWWGGVYRVGVCSGFVRGLFAGSGGGGGGVGFGVTVLDGLSCAGRVAGLGQVSGRPGY